MRSIRLGRAPSLALILLAALASSGCPELNRQPERGDNPLFSVYDPAGQEAVPATRTTDGIPE